MAAELGPDHGRGTDDEKGGEAKKGNGTGKGKNKNIFPATANEDGGNIDALLARVQGFEAHLERLHLRLEATEGGIADMAARLVGFSGGLQAEKAQLLEGLNGELDAQRVALQQVVHDARAEFGATQS